MSKVTALFLVIASVFVSGATGLQKKISFDDKMRMKKLAATEIKADTQNELNKAGYDGKTITMKVAVPKKSVESLSLITSITAKVGNKSDGYPLFLPFANSLMPDVAEEIKANGVFTIVYENASSRKFKAFSKFLEEQKTEDAYVVCYVSFAKEIFDSYSSIFGIPNNTVRSYWLKDWASVEMYEGAIGKADSAKSDLIPTNVTLLEKLNDDSYKPFVIKAKLKLSDYYNYYFDDKAKMFYSFDLSDSSKLGHGYIARNSRGKELFAHARNGNQFDAIVKLRFVPSVKVGDSGRDDCIFIEDYKILQ